MVWAGSALIAAIAIGLPVAAWWFSRDLKPPRQPMGGPGPRFDRVDRWLFDRYQLGVLDRWRVRQAVFDGRTLSEPVLRGAAHDLATDVLVGKVGGFVRRGGWILIAEGAFIVAAAIVVTVIRNDYAFLAPVLVGLPQLVLGEMSRRRTRQALERARQLNE